MKTFILSIIRGISWKEIPWIICFLLVSYIFLSKTYFSQEPEIRTVTEIVTETVLETDTIYVQDTLIVYKEIEIPAPQEPNDSTRIYNIDISDSLIQANIEATIRYPMILSNLDFSYKPLFPIEIRTTETKTVTTTDTQYITEYQRKRMLGIGGAVGISSSRSIYVKPSIFYFTGSATWRLSYDYVQDVVWVGTEIPIL